MTNTHAETDRTPISELRDIATRARTANDPGDRVVGKEYERALYWAFHRESTYQYDVLAGYVARLRARDAVLDADPAERDRIYAWTGHLVKSSETPWQLRWDLATVLAIHDIRKS